MTLLSSYFVKHYDRPIETVIKADDRTHIYDEVAEYVVTRDIAGKIANFFEAYRDGGSTNGVWISGFFGSGKSHLLKILSYVLENRAYGEESLGRLFAEKIQDDPKLKADILHSIEKHPSESILFNIDQQAQLTSKADQNALLQVFYKVFYDHQGFYGFQPHIAEFEAYLTREKKYDAFKTAFEDSSGKSWVDARKDYVDPLIGDAIAEALSKAYGTDADKYEDYLDSWEDKHKASIEDFAGRVADYIAAKGKGFRLNFFVDEVGQYIAENTKLMLNLQTIAESLDTKCKGNSWVFVTSQEDLESLVGDDRQIQKDDFSKIQGRFSNRIPLTSSNVDEVIEKRLLEKNENGKTTFGEWYQKEQANLKTLLSFSETGLQFKFYKDKTDFVKKYPFVPYQFDLFQQSIKSLSRHNVFQGKHASVGERSMLGVFQEVLKSLKDFRNGDLVSYDRMFGGIAGTLRSEAQNAILLAGNQLEQRNPLAVRVLKTLFLIKYFDGFKATARNIQTLLTDNVHTPVNEVKKEVEQALNLLEEQTYIQRRGEVYEYLTNEEKDIEEEIKSVSIEDADVSKYLSTVIFSGLLGDTKIKYLPNKQEFDYARLVDGLLTGKPQELQLSFATADYPDYGNESHFSAKTLSDATLMMVRLPEDKRFMKEVRMYLRTDKYIRHNNTSGNTDSFARILREKGTFNSRRNVQIEQMAKDLVSRAQIFLNGSENTRSASADARTRIQESFQDLIQVAYPKLDLLGTAPLDEAQLTQILNRNDVLNLFGGDDTAISPAEGEVLNYINRRKAMSERTTLTDIRAHFHQKPYGWRMIASFCIVALLYKRGKIEARQNTNTLEDASFALALNNNTHWNNTLIVPQQEVDGTLLRKVKDLHKDLFHDTNIATEPKEIVRCFKDKAQVLLQELDDLLRQTDAYPFLQKLKPLQTGIKGLLLLDAHALINTVKDYADDLLDAKEDVLDKIRSFMNSDQLKIYKAIGLFLNENNSNLRYVESKDETAQLIAIKAQDAPYAGDGMRKAKEAMDTLADRIRQQQDTERTQTRQRLEDAIHRLQEEPDFRKLGEVQQTQMLEPFASRLRNAAKEPLISHIRDSGANLSDIYTRQLNECVRLAQPPKPYAPGNTPATPDANEPDNPTSPKEVYITLATTLKKVDADLTRLETEADVEAYLAALKKTLLDQLAQNRKINLN